MVPEAPSPGLGPDFWTMLEKGSLDNLLVLQAMLANFDFFKQTPPKPVFSLFTGMTFFTKVWKIQKARFCKKFGLILVDFEGV